MAAVAPKQRVHTPGLRDKLERAGFKRTVPSAARLYGVPKARETWVWSAEEQDDEARSNPARPPSWRGGRGGIERLRKYIWAYDMPLVTYAALEQLAAERGRVMVGEPPIGSDTLMVDFSLPKRPSDRAKKLASLLEEMGFRRQRPAGARSNVRDPSPVWLGEFRRVGPRKNPSRGRR